MVIGHLLKVIRDNPDVTPEELLWEGAMIKDGHVRDVMTAEEKDAVQSDLSDAEAYLRLAEWDFPEDLAGESPKVGVVAALCAILSFERDVLTIENANDLLGTAISYARTFSSDKAVLKRAANKLMEVGTAPVVPLISLTTRLQRGEAPRRGFAEDAIRLSFAVMAPKALNFGLENKACVGKSEIHGRGVFASRDIEKGELITLYPSCLIRFDGQSNDTIKLFASGEYDGSLEGFSLNNNTLLNAYDGSIEFLPCVERVEDPQAGVLGHMVNSCLKSTLLRRMLLTRGNSYTTGFLGGTLAGVFARRHICTGEEILGIYGMHYDWAQTNSSTTSKIRATTSLLGEQEK